MGRIDSFREQFWHKLSELRMIPWIVGESCCRVELLAVSKASYAWQRLGLVDVAKGPFEANLLIVSGWLNEKQAEEVKAAYAVMLHPRYVIAVGSCAISGSPFKVGSNSLVVLSDLVKVDIYVPGCPPRPETLLDAILLLRKQTRPQNQSEKAIYDAIRPLTNSK